MVLAGPPRLYLLAGRALHQPLHQPKKEDLSGSPEKSLGDGSQRYSTTSHLVWGRVVPDIPDFCRELVAALSEG
jgi:hypothetical protein